MSTCKIDTSHWHRCGANDCDFIRKQYKPNVKSLCILNESKRTMLSHISIYLKERIVVLHEEGRTDFFGFQWEELCVPPSGDECFVGEEIVVWGINIVHQSKIAAEIAASVEAKLLEDELTSVEIQRLLIRKFSISISVPTIRRYIQVYLNWVVVRTRFGPMILDKIKAKSSAFAQMVLDTSNTFDNVIRTDESSVQGASTEVCCKSYCQNTCLGRNP